MNQNQLIATIGIWYKQDTEKFLEICAVEVYFIFIKELI